MIRSLQGQLSQREHLSLRGDETCFAREYHDDRAMLGLGHAIFGVNCFKFIYILFLYVFFFLLFPLHVLCFFLVIM